MAGTGGNMMASLQLSGVADSGYGITMAGFHCPTMEFTGRLEELKKKLPDIIDFDHWEDNGFVTFIAYCREGLSIPLDRKIATLRREPHKLFIDLPKFLAQTKAQFIDKMTLTGSLGSISLTVLYRAVKEPGE